jgi:hypothetical protein
MTGQQLTTAEVAAGYTALWRPSGGNCPTAPRGHAR